MKFTKVLKRASVLLMSLSVLAFASCSNNDASNQAEDDGTTSSEDTTAAEKTAYSLTFNEDVSALSVNIGETLTLTIKDKVGTWKLNEDDISSEVEVSLTDTALTIKGLAETDTAYIGLYPEEAGDDISYDQELKVKVWGLYALNVQLSDELAEKAAAVSVNYGYNSGTYETVTGTVDSETGIAVVNLKKSLSGTSSWAGWNNMTVKLLDSDGAELDVLLSYQNWLSYDSNDSEYLETLKVEQDVAEKTFTLTFKGFTAKSVTGLKYYYTKKVDGEDVVDKETETDVTVAEDGKSGTFTVVKANVNASGWFAVNFSEIVITDTDDAEVTLTSGNTDSWFDYSTTLGSTLAVVTGDYTGTIVTDASISGAASTAVAVLVVADDMPESASAIKFTYTVGTDDIVGSSTWISLYSDSSWSNETKLVNAWVDGFEATATEFTYEISDSTVVTAFLEGGVYFAADSASYTGTVTITYIPAN